MKRRGCVRWVPLFAWLCGAGCSAGEIKPNPGATAANGGAATENSMMSADGGTGGKGGNAANPPSTLLDGGVRLLDASRSPTDTCPMATVTAARVIPSIVLVIDQSGSMNDSFGADGGSRWTVLRDFLLKPDGLIATFEKQVRFGLAMYSALESEGPSQCPKVTSVAPMLMNYQAISQSYKSAMPLGETPTGDSIDKIVASLPAASLDKNADPVVLILATDGEPDRCEQLNPQRGQDEAVAAVKNAFAMGIRTYIISVGDEVSMQHQQDVANAGVGHKADDPAQYWKAGDDASLRKALTEIVGSQVSCDVTLEGDVQGGNPCDGTVELNGKKLDCNGQDGWKLADSKHLRLQGKACDDFKSLSNASVLARFPCSVQIVF